MHASRGARGTGWWRHRWPPGTEPGQFQYPYDLAFAPNGDLLLLERKFSWTAGVAMRLRRIALSSITPASLVDGKILIAADMGYQIDNMEGLSVHRDASGALVLTVVSDDNFSPLQRTILLQFALND